MRAHRLRRPSVGTFFAAKWATTLERPGGRDAVVRWILWGMGPTTFQRRSWVFMDSIPWTGCPRVTPASMQRTLFD